MIDLEHLNKRAKRRFAKYVDKGPSLKTDGEGYIYVYYLNTDPHDTFYKIGRTHRPVDKRLREWKGAKLKMSCKVQYQKYSERLIHTLLDHVRVYRYLDPDTKEYYTIWKNTGKPVDPHQQETKLAAHKKHIEWFKGSWKQLLKPLVFQALSIKNEFWVYLSFGSDDSELMISSIMFLTYSVACSLIIVFQSSLFSSAMHSSMDSLRAFISC